MMTDPIGDALIRIKNGYMARKTHVEIPRSNLVHALLKLLAENGYVARTQPSPPAGRMLTVELKYTRRRPAMEGVRRISHPSRRNYQSARALASKKPAEGILVVSSTSGLMTSDTAVKKNHGGEALCHVW